MKKQYNSYIAFLSKLLRTPDLPSFNLKLYITFCQQTQHFLETHLKKPINVHLCSERQTLAHLFASCSKVKSFWSHFTNWWNFKNSESITLDENMIIYGVANDFSRRLGLNLCLIIAKTLHLHCLQKRRRVLLGSFHGRS